MSSKVLFATFLCIVAAFYLSLEWLAILLSVFLFFVVLGSLPKEKKMPVARSQEEIIYPVIYEDVGESPWLYHPESKIEVNPEWEPATQWASAGAGMANIFKATANLIRGKKEEK